MDQAYRKGVTVLTIVKLGALVISVTHVFIPASFQNHHELLMGDAANSIVHQGNGGWFEAFQRHLQTNVHWNVPQISFKLGLESLCL